MKIIGIGEYAVSNNSNEVIKTFALSSCIALTIYCTKTATLGMAHIVLPESKINPEQGKERPGYFADTAVPLLIKKICTEACCEYSKCRKRFLEVNIFGGAKSSSVNDIFKIGERNTDAVLNSLLENNLSCVQSDTGGYVSRTLEAEVSTGKTRVFSSAMLRFR